MLSFPVLCHYNWDPHPHRCPVVQGLHLSSGLGHAIPSPVPYSPSCLICFPGWSLKAHCRQLAFSPVSWMSPRYVLALSSVLVWAPAVPHWVSVWIPALTHYLNSLGAVSTGSWCHLHGCPGTAPQERASSLPELPSLPFPIRIYISFFKCMKVVNVNQTLFHFPLGRRLTRHK